MFHSPNIFVQNLLFMKGEIIFCLAISVCCMACHGGGAKSVSDTVVTPTGTLTNSVTPPPPPPPPTNHAKAVTSQQVPFKIFSIDVDQDDNGIPIALLTSTVSPVYIIDGLNGVNPCFIIAAATINGTPSITIGNNSSVYVQDNSGIMPSIL